MLEILLFLVKYGYIILGISFGITSSMFLTALFLEKSIENGNKAGNPEDFDAQIKIVVEDSSSTLPTNLMSNSGYYYKDSK